MDLVLAYYFILNCHLTEMLILHPVMLSLRLKMDQRYSQDFVFGIQRRVVNEVEFFKVRVLKKKT
eukprot:UN12699